MTFSSGDAVSTRIGRSRVAGSGGGEEIAGVFLCRGGQQSAGARRFLHLTVAQDRDAVRDLRDHREIMRDIDARGVAIADRALESLQHLDLRRHVEGGGRFVEDHDIRVGDERHCRHEALKLSARDLMRITLADGLRLGDRHGAEEADGLFARGGFICRAVDARGLDHLLHDRAGRVEGGRRTLRDIGHAPAAQLAQGRFAQSGHVGCRPPARSRRKYGSRNGHSP